MLAVAMAARAEQSVVGLRVGTHRDHGRLVFDCPRPMDYQAEQDGDRIFLRFPQPVQFRLDAAARARIRNLGSIRQDMGVVVIEAAPGTVLRHFRLGNRVVLDLVDGPAPPQARSSPTAVPASPVTHASSVAGASRSAPLARAAPRSPAIQATAPGPAGEIPTALAVAVPSAPLPSEAAGTPGAASSAAPLPAAGPSAPRPAVAAEAPHPPAAVERPAPGTAAMAERPGNRTASVAMAALRPGPTVAPPTRAAPATPPAEGLGPPREEAERDLRQLGYAGVEARPMGNREFRDAVRAYQSRIGDAPTGTLTYAQGERLRRAAEMLVETRVTAGSLLFTAGPRMVTAAGTWSPPDGQGRHPVNRSYISCQREMEMCFEAAAHLALSEAGAGGALASELVLYRIVAWLPEIIIAERNQRCVTRVLVLQPGLGRISLADRPHPTPECRPDTVISEGILQLRSGMEPIARYYDARRADAEAELGPVQRPSRRAALSLTP